MGKPGIRKHGKIVVLKSDPSSKRYPSGLALGDYISIERYDNPKNSLKGIVEYIGTVSFAEGSWTGIRLVGQSVGEGANNGSVRGKKYFECGEKGGLFIHTGAASSESSDGSNSNNRKPQRKRLSFDLDEKRGDEIGAEHSKNTGLSSSNSVELAIQKVQKGEKSQATSSLTLSTLQDRDAQNSLLSTLSPQNDSPQSSDNQTSGSRSESELNQKEKTVLARVRKSITSFNVGVTASKEELGDSLISSMQKEKDELSTLNEELMAKQLSTQLELLRLRNLTISLEKELSKHANIPTSVQVYRDVFSQYLDEDDNSEKEIKDKLLAQLEDPNSTQDHNQNGSSSGIIDEETSTKLMSEIEKLKSQLQIKSSQLTKTFSAKRELESKNEKLEDEILILQKQIYNTSKAPEPGEDEINRLKAENMRLRKKIEQSKETKDIPDDSIVDSQKSTLKKKIRYNPLPSFASEYNDEIDEGENHVQIDLRSSLVQQRCASIGKQIANIENLDELSNSTNDTKDYRTLSRVLVTRYLSKMKWYNPLYYKSNRARASVSPGGNRLSFDTGSRSNIFKKSETPDLQRAWAFYEHYTLARYTVQGRNNSDKVRAIPGTLDKTNLYTVWGTKEHEMDSWGVDIILYFSILRKLVLLFLLMGFLNISCIIFYSRPEYYGDELETSSFTRLINRGSALCNKFEYVECDDCAKYQFHDSVIDENGLYRKNLCDPISDMNGIINLTSICLVTLGFLVIYIFQERREQVADQNKLSSSDYSIVVSNPPEEAIDPEEWREFFGQFDEYKPPLVTIVLNNEHLVDTLSKLRYNRRKLEVMLPGTDIDDEGMVAAKIYEKETKLGEAGFLQRFMVNLLNLLGVREGERSVREKIKKYKEQTRKLRQQKYSASKIYITMETERGQRAALRALDAGAIARVRDNTGDGIVRFRGVVLNAKEAKEPGAVIWTDQSTKTKTKMLQRIFTFLLLFLTLYVIIFFVNLTNSPLQKALVIRAGNMLGPRFLRSLGSFEAHGTMSARQISMFTKLTIFRWAITVVGLLIITPTEKILSGNDDDLIPTIASVLMLETAPQILRVIDVNGTINKHYRAPRASTQEEMNSNFQGTSYNLGERYTDMTKLVFFCLFYSLIYPAGYFIGAVGLFVQYWVDKFCLLRVWSFGYDTGPEISEMNRDYFMFLAAVIFSLASAYFWAGIPFDNLCEKGDGKYKYCDQNLYSVRETTFPPLDMIIGRGGEWMTSTQRKYAIFFGWVSLILVFIFALVFLRRQFHKYIRSLCRGSYKSVGQDMQVDFSSAYVHKTDMLAYVPHVDIPGFLFPCFACNIDSFRGHGTLVGWEEDRINKYDYYNLIHDLPPLDEGEVDNENLFSIAKYWPRFEF